MSKNVEQVLKKLDHPPAGHNFARSNFQSAARTTNALVNLALGFPTVSYRWGIDAISAQLTDHLSNQDTRILLRRNCPPAQLDHNEELLVAFQAYNNERQFDGIPVYPEFCGNYMASPDVAVPIKPTALLREGGIIKPLFVIGWATNPLNWHQRRLLTSMHEDAIYSLTDLRASDGETLVFPRDGYGIRQASGWKRTSYQPLSRGEMVDQAERFVRARERARTIIPLRLVEINQKRQAKTVAPSKTHKSSPEPKR